MQTSNVLRRIWVNNPFSYDFLVHVGLHQDSVLSPLIDDGSAGNINNKHDQCRTMCSICWTENPSSTLIISYKGLIISVYVQVRLRNVMLFTKMYSVLKYVTCYMHDLSTSTITLEKFILIHTLELIATWLVCTALFKTSEGL